MDLIKMNKFTRATSIIILLFFSLQSNAGIITWDYEFEVSFVEDRTNGLWLNPLTAGDIISASLSFDSDTPIISDSASQTVFDVTNATLDITELSSDLWLNNLTSPVAWTNHSGSRESGNIRSSYTVDNALMGDINWEAIIFSFRDDSPTNSYTSFPIDWSSVSASFTYHRDLDANSSGSEIYVTGEMISAVQRVSVPEPSSMFLLFFGLILLFNQRNKA
jgi:hypothetical protein